MTSHIKEWLGLIQQGREQVFYNIYSDLQPPLFGFLVARSKSREDAKDLLQDIFIDLWRSLKHFQYRSDKQFYAMVFKIARRKLSRYYQKSKITLEFDEKYYQDNYQEFPEDHRFLFKGLGKLSDKYRIVLELRYWSQLSFREIADRLGDKENNIKVRHHRAIKKMAEILEESYGG